VRGAPTKNVFMRLIIFLAAFHTTLEIPDVDGRPKCKDCFIKWPRLSVPSMCPQRLPEEHKSSVPLVRVGHLRRGVAEHTTQRSGRERSGYFLLCDVSGTPCVFASAWRIRYRNIDSPSRMDL
jgi:hypothetical protein